MIGVFDSGFGGLSVLKDIRARLPQYSYAYLGDAARAPYGPRSSEEVLAFSKEAVDFLFARGAELIIFACNTASAEALHDIQQNYLPGRYGPNKRVLGVLVPIAEHVAETGARRIGVVATLGTVRSQAYVREIGKHAPEAEVFQNAAPDLVPLVEAGKHETAEAEATVSKYILPLLQKNIDALVLGCTHYGLLAPLFVKAAGSGIRVIPGPDIVAGKLESYLMRHTDIEASLIKGGSVDFYTTGDPRAFETLGRSFLGEEVSGKRAELG